jgi:hypothetical protein
VTADGRGRDSQDAVIADSRASTHRRAAIAHSKAVTTDAKEPTRRNAVRSAHWNGLLQLRLTERAANRRRAAIAHSKA